MSPSFPSKPIGRVVPRQPVHGRLPRRGEMVWLYQVGLRAHRSSAHYRAQLHRLIGGLREPVGRLHPRDDRRPRQRRPAAARAARGRGRAVIGPRGDQGLQGETGPQGEQGPAGPARSAGRAGCFWCPRPAGPAGVLGLPGPAGPAWLYQPSAGELASKVKQAALDVTPRTVLDPRVGVRYLATLTSRLIKLQGGLILRAIVDTDAAANNQPDADLSNVRSIA